MQQNPYASTKTRPAQFQNQLNQKKNLVLAPAIALLSVSGLSCLVLLFYIPVTIFQILVVGVPEARGPTPVSPTALAATSLLIQFVMAGVSGFTVYASIRMIQFKDYGLAKNAAICACIPCVSPLCFLGIPFGIWTLIVLNKPFVPAMFKS